MGLLVFVVAVATQLFASLRSPCREDSLSGFVVLRVVASLRAFLQSWVIRLLHATETGTQVRSLHGRGIGRSVLGHEVLHDEESLDLLMIVQGHEHLLVE